MLLSTTMHSKATSVINRDRSTFWLVELGGPFVAKSVRILQLKLS